MIDLILALGVTCGQLGASATCELPPPSPCEQSIDRCDLNGVPETGENQS